MTEADREADRVFTLLLLEDNPAYANLVKEWLDDAAIHRREDFQLGGHGMTWAETCREALARLKVSSFGVILADLTLPDSEGLETVDALLAAAPHTPLIVLSGRNDEMLAIEAVRRGAQDYLIKKHVDGALLGRAICYAVERKRSERMIADHARHMSEANQELEAFAYTIAHDLRAPLSNMRGFLQILLDDHQDGLSPEGRECLQWLEESAEQMEARITDYLQLSRSSRTPLNKQRFDLSGMAKTIAGNLQQRDPGRHVELVIQLGVEVTADPHLLMSVLENLMDNAWKFTARRDDARIEFGTQETDSGQRCYYVCDNGVGFDAYRIQGKPFAPFLRLHTMTDFTGSGIGLASAQRIINRHGGRIWVDSEVGLGATFFFTLGDDNEDGKKRGLESNATEVKQT